MKLLKNAGTDRVLDELRSVLISGATLDIATPELSLFAFAELRDLIAKCAASRLILPDPSKTDLAWLGGPADRGSRNKLLARWLAKQCYRWVGGNCEVQQAPAMLPQSIFVVRPPSGTPVVLTGNCSFTTAGLGLTPGNLFGMIQATESAEEAAMLSGWFGQLWAATTGAGAVRPTLLAQLAAFSEHRPAETAYLLSLVNLFFKQLDEIDEDRIVKSATAIKNTFVWRKLFRFKRDGVVGVIDKLER